jgi:hypothetical protein
MDEVQKPSNSECYTPSSEPFRIYVHIAHAIWNYEKDTANALSWFLF